MKAPVFAYGTMDALEKAIEKGKIKYPAYVWLKDTLQYAFINKNQQIELVGLPKLTGTLDQQLILSELSGGVYEIKGQYKITENAETVFLSASYVIAIIKRTEDGAKVRLITADNIYDFTTEGEDIIETDKNVTVKYLEEHNYVTEQQVDDKIAVMEITLKEELVHYVDEIIADQIAALLPEELNKILQPYTLDDIRNLFDVPSV